MKAIISKLFSEGDSYLKEAKAMFLLKKEEQCDASCHSCKAIKKYLDAYEKYLYEQVNPTENYHVTIHLITQKDPGFKKFTGKIFEVKCFAEESRREKEGFFLYADEVNDALKIVMEVRNYIARKIKLHDEFLSEFSAASFMAI